MIPTVGIIPRLSSPPSSMTRTRRMHVADAATKWARSNRVPVPGLRRGPNGAKIRRWCAHCPTTCCTYSSRDTRDKCGEHERRGEGRRGDTSEKETGRGRRARRAGGENLRWASGLVDLTHQLSSCCQIPIDPPPSEIGKAGGARRQLSDGQPQSSISLARTRTCQIPIALSSSPQLCPSLVEGPDGEAQAPKAPSPTSGWMNREKRKGLLHSAEGEAYSTVTYSDLGWERESSGALRTRTSRFRVYSTYCKIV
ncbi:hypothetical protein BD414DRAFT_496788, partial [Trametes punicea]